MSGINPEISKILSKSVSLFRQNFGNTNGAAAAAKLREYIIEQEYEDVEYIIDDISGGAADSDLVTALEDSLRNETPQSIYRVLRILLELESTEEEQKEPSNVNKKVPNILKMISNLDWKITQKDKDFCHKLISNQCPGLIRDTEDLSLLEIVAVGRKNRIHLLSVLVDAYAKYRVSARMSKSSSLGFCGPLLTIQDFLDELSLNSSIGLNIKSSIKSFTNRLVPEYSFTNAILIDDDINAYIEYTLMVAQIMQTYVLNTSCLPLQVDLIIIPQNIIQSTLFSGIGTGDDEYDDDEPDEPMDYNSESVISGASNIPDSKKLEENIRKILSDENFSRKPLQYSSPPQNTNCDGKNYLFVGKDCRVLRDSIAQFVSGKKHKRISIVIDRRVQPNIVYVFTLDEIPTDYFIGSLIAKASTTVIPDIAGKSKKRHFIGGGNSGVFQISFQYLENNHTRLQWFFSGCGIRLWPELMIGLWPTCFKKQDVDDRYTAGFIRDQFMLYNIVDPIFDSYKPTV